MPPRKKRPRLSVADEGEGEEGDCAAGGVRGRRGIELPGMPAAANRALLADRKAAVAFMSNWMSAGE